MCKLMNYDQKKYIKPFDGLRVIALLSVFFYHLIPNIVPSGYLGVVIFFVLAGFLSMLPYQNAILDDSSIDNEIPSNTNQKFKDSLYKIFIKILKLYPSLIITIIIVTIIMCFFFKTFLPSYFMEAITSFLSINNFYQIFKHESYFEAMNSMKPLTHIWALSLEFQFYIIFYIIVATFYNRKNHQKFFIGFIITCVLSYILSFVLILSDAELTRVYYGLDTRLSAFLIGVIACVISNKFRYIIKRYLKLFRLLEFILLVLIILPMFFTFNTNFSTILILNVYSLVFSLLIIIFYNEHLIYSLKSRDAIRRNKKLILRMLIYNILSYDKLSLVVKRSYIIYLIHYPTIIFANRFTAHIEMPLIVYVLLLITMTIVIVEAIYRFLLFVNSFIASKKTAIIIYSSMIVLLAATLTFAKIITPVVKEINYDEMVYDDSIINDLSDTSTSANEESSVGANDSLESSQLSNLSESNNSRIEVTEQSDHAFIETSTTSPNNLVDPSMTSPSNIEETTALIENPTKVTPPPGVSEKIMNSCLRRIQKVNKEIGDTAILDEATFFKTYGFKLTVIGDSLTSSAKGSMTLYFPNSFVNSKGNREISDALDVFNEMKANGEIGDAIVFGLGTNSTHAIDVDSLEAIYNEVTKLGKPMIILSIVLPYRAQETERNTDLQNFVDTHTNCYLADWHSSAKTHKECFMEDNIHPTGIGNDLYCQVIYKAYIKSLN